MEGRSSLKSQIEGLTLIIIIYQLFHQYNKQMCFIARLCGVKSANWLLVLIFCILLTKSNQNLSDILPTVAKAEVTYTKSVLDQGLVTLILFCCLLSVYTE